MTVPAPRLLRRARAGLLGLLAFVAAPVAAQDAGGARKAAIVGTVWDSTAAGPLAGATVVVSGTDRSASTDAAGRFRLEDVPAGAYTLSLRHPRLEALGTDPPSAAVTVGDGGEARAELALPGWGTVLARSCGSGGAALAGTVRDPEGRPLPAASVVLSWGAAAARSTARATADAAGSFRLCGLPAAAPLAMRVSRPGRVAQEEALRLDGGEVRVLALTLDPSPERWVAGRVVETESGRGVPGVRLSAVGTGAAATTDRDGRVALLLPTGRSEMEVDQGEKGTRRVSVIVPDEGPAAFLLRLPGREYVLDEIRVVGRTTREQELLARGTATYSVQGEDLARFQRTGASFVDLARSRLRLNVVPMGSSATDFCIEGPLRSRAASMGGGCQSVEVYLDDIRIAEPSEFLSDLRLDDIERVEYLSPLEAGTRYGSHAGRGVILLYTSRGPARSAGSR